MAQQNGKPPLSHTLWSPIDTVKDVSDSIGLTDLSDDTSRNLAMDVEYRIHEILEQAVKFMRHSKRRTLSTQDIDKALRVLNVEPLYGYDVARPLNFKEALVGNGQTLYYIDDEEVDFEKLINQPLPKVPRITNFTSHWLAIEGVQPSIPQNPLESEIRAILPSYRGAIANVLTENSVSNGVSSTSAHNGNTSSVNININNKDAEIKPLVKHVLSKELQLYFNKVANALVKDSTDDETLHLKQAAMTSLRSDPGLHQLVPYFVQFISEQITHNLNNISLLSTMLEVIYSLLSNSNIFLDPYVHALMPCVLTLLLAKRIGTSTPKSSNADTDIDMNGQEPSPSAENDEHIAVREFASQLLEHVCNNYGQSYSTLKPRVTRTLLKAFLDAEKPVGTLFGSIIGLKVLGQEVIRITILGNLYNWSVTVLENPALKEEHKTLLLETVVKALRELTDKGNDGNDNEMEVEITDAQKKKLEDRVGKLVSNKILEQPDAKKIIDAIFFGDLST